MTHQEYTLAKRSLYGGSHVVVATILASQKQIRVIAMRTKNSHYQGKNIADGKWYLIESIEVQS